VIQENFLLLLLSEKEKKLAIYGGIRYNIVEICLPRGGFLYD